MELGAMFWKPSPGVVISSGTGGTPVDFVTSSRSKTRDSGVPRRPEGGAKAQAPLQHGADRVFGSATLNQPITFQGQTYNVDLPATAELKWTLMRFGYEWDPISTTMGFAGVIVDAKYNKMNAQLSAPSPIGTTTFERNITVPTIGGIVRGYLSQFSSITGELTALKFKHGGLDATFYDFDVYGTANFGRYVGARSVTAR
jgi:hypothetical protein